MSDQQAYQLHGPVFRLRCGDHRWALTPYCLDYGDGRHGRVIIWPWAKLLHRLFGHLGTRP